MTSRAHDVPGAREVYMKDFSAEMQKWTAILQDEKVEWERRLSVLQQMRAFFEHDPSSQPDYLSVMSATARTALKEQIEDLRSSISKEACACVKALCICTGPSWEPLSDWYVAALLGNTCATVAVMADAAEDALATLATCGVVSGKALSMYLHGTAAKHSTVRRNAFASLLRILSHCDQAFVAKYSSQVAKAIRSGLSDAVQAPRQLARLCYWALEAVCRDDADRLMSGCEAAVQRTLEQEKGAFFVWMQEGRLPETCQATKRGMAPKNTNTASGSTRPDTGDNAKGLLSPQKAPQSAAALDRPTTAARGPAKGVTVQPQAAVRRESPVPRDPPATAKLPAPSAKPAAAKGQPALAAKAPSPPTPSTQAAAQQRPATSARSASAHAKAMAPKPESARAPSPPPQPKQVAPAARPKVAVASKRPATAFTAVEDGWAEIVTATENADWSTRANAVSSIAELIEMGALAHDTDAIRIIMEKLGDSHYKVAINALGALHRLLDAKPDVCCPILERLFTILFAKQADAKLKDGVRAALQAIGSTFGTEVLVPVLNKVIDANQKTRVASLEFLLHMVSGATAGRYFNSQSAMKLLLGKIVLVSQKDKSTTLADVSKNILAQLYAHNTDGFIQAVLGLTNADQMLVAELTKTKIPQLAQDCRRAAAGDPLLPNAPTVADSLMDLAGTRRRVELALSPTPFLPSATFSPSAKVKGFGGSSSPTKSPSQPQAAAAGNNNKAKSALRSRVDSVGHSQYFDPTTYDAASARNADVFDLNRNDYTLRFNDPLLSPGVHTLRIKELNILKNAVSSDERRDAIRIGQQSLSNESLWLEHFAKLLPFALAFARSDDHGIRVLSFRWLLNIVSCEVLREQSEAALEHFARVIAHGIDDAYPEVRSEAAVLAGDAFHRFRPSGTVLAILSLLEHPKFVESCSGKALTFLIDEMSKAYLRGGPLSTAVQHVSRIVPAVIAHTDCVETDVRKAVVLALADMFFCNAEALLPHLKGMPHAKLRLVEMYINRGGRDDVRRPGEPVRLIQMIESLQS